MECHRYISEETYFVSKIHGAPSCTVGSSVDVQKGSASTARARLNLGMLGFTKVCFSVWLLVFVRPPAGAALDITPITTYLVILTGAMCKIPGFAANKASRRSAKQMPATRVVLGKNRPTARNIPDTPVIAA